MKVVIVDDICEFSNIIKKSIIQVLIEENLDIGILTFDKYTKGLNRLIYSNEIKIYILDYDLGEKIHNKRNAVVLGISEYNEDEPTLAITEYADKLGAGLAAMNFFS